MFIFPFNIKLTTEQVLFFWFKAIFRPHENPMHAEALSLRLCIVDAVNLLRTF